MPYWFPDTTVLRNFAAVRQTSLLFEVLGNDGRCVQAIDREIKDAVTVVGYDDLRQVVEGQLLGTPIEIDDITDILLVQRIRVDELGGKRTEPRENLGEAETIFVLRTDGTYAGSFWVTDDAAAYDFGRRSGLRTMCTRDVVAVAIHRGLIALPYGFDLLTRMGTRQRVLAYTPTSSTDLERWVNHWASELLDDAASGDAP